MMKPSPKAVASGMQYERGLLGVWVVINWPLTT
jgi:hypothetical protein